MSYTLRGRLESRLAAALLPALAAPVLAGALGEWWPLELVGLMLGVGLALDATAYHRLVPYQAAWLALPFGALELGLTMALAIALGVGAPLGAAVALFGGAWLVAQVLAHAGFPLAHLTYADEGGELGRAGPALWAAAPLALAASLGVAWALQPPTVRLEAGVHPGPLILDKAQRLVGEPGAVVRGGIVVTADDVTVEDVSVMGAETGVIVQDAENVVLDGVDVTGASLDGIQARRSQVTIRHCAVSSPASDYAQAIDISFAMELPPSVVEDCLISGGREGIVTNLANVTVRGNRVEGTALRAISLTEMSMGMIESNVVRDANGVGIFCGDYSHCEIERNTVFGTRPDRASGDPSRLGYAIQANFYGRVTIEANALSANARGVGTFTGGTVSAAARR
ncbi:MAG TPA: right-handed parallel beta-helix repeat-containing protein [Gaiellaceae bacterium]|nr:right-handed parallel beta-helix repeat-containing protein [Gaiellaceae bacterium]